MQINGENAESINQQQQELNRCHPIHELYDYNQETQKSKCKICGFSANGKHSNNLVKHVQSRHKNDPLWLRAFEKIQLMRASKASQHDKSIGRNSKKVDDIVVLVPFTRKELRNAFTKMVTIDGRPFKIAEDKGVLMLTEKVHKAFDAANISLRINRRNLVTWSNEKFAVVRKRIKCELRGKFISIQFDICKARDR